MTEIAFSKVEGLGNDFVLLDERDRAQPKQSLKFRSQFSQQICDRRRGIGADGVLTLLAPKSKDAVCSMHVTNADGSNSEMCGNGLRGVACWLVQRGEVPAGETFVIDTDAGPRSVSVSEAGSRVSIAMGPASVNGVLRKGELLAAPLKHGRHQFTVSAFSIGNPHLVLMDALQGEVSTGPGLPSDLGPILSGHTIFVAGANIGFAYQHTPTEIDLVVYERGAGLTQACGTGACAAAAAYVQAGRAPADKEIEVTLPGGTLCITVAADLSNVQMEGPAHVVFDGVLRGRS